MPRRKNAPPAYGDILVEPTEGSIRDRQWTAYHNLEESSFTRYFDDRASALRYARGEVRPDQKIHIFARVRRSERESAPEVETYGVAARKAASDAKPSAGSGSGSGTRSFFDRVRRALNDLE